MSNIENIARDKYSLAANACTNDSIERIRKRLPMSLTVESVAAFMEKVRDGTDPDTAEKEVGAIQGVFKAVLPQLDKWTRRNSSETQLMVIFDDEDASAWETLSDKASAPKISGPYRAIPKLLTDGMSKSSLSGFLDTISVEQPSAEDYGTICAIHWMLCNGAAHVLEGVSEESTVFARTAVRSYDMLELARKSSMSAMADVMRFDLGTYESNEAAKAAMEMFETSRELRTIANADRKLPAGHKAAQAARHKIATAAGTKSPMLYLETPADMSYAQVLRTAETNGIPANPKPSEVADQFRALVERQKSAVEPATVPLR